MEVGYPFVLNSRKFQKIFTGNGSKYFFCNKNGYLKIRFADNNRKESMEKQEFFFLKEKSFDTAPNVCEFIDKKASVKTLAFLQY